VDGYGSGNSAYGDAVVVAGSFPEACKRTTDPADRYLKWADRYPNPPHCWVVRTLPFCRLPGSPFPPISYSQRAKAVPGGGLAGLNRTPEPVPGGC
jgi:hypothetical protein